MNVRYGIANKDKTKANKWEIIVKAQIKMKAIFN